MPFLTVHELDQFIPQSWALQIIKEPLSFDRAEEAAAYRVRSITGIDIPTDAAEAPAWAKGPVAHMIFYARIGFLNPTPEQLSWAAGLNRQAIADLESHQIQVETDRAGAVIKPIGGLIDDIL